MPKSKRKKAPRKAAKKAPRKAAKKAAASPRAHAGSHLDKAHRSLLKVVTTVTANNREDIAKVRRALDHLEANARAHARR